MLLWILAICFLAVAGLVAFYQGALRAAFTLVGLLAAAFFCIPVGDLLKPLLSLCGLKHPALLMFIGPALAFALLLTVFKVGALFVFKKADTHYKYHESDTKRLLWERLNARAGVCIGVANGAIYFFLLCVVIYVVGYSTVQLAASDRESVWLRLMNYAARQVEATGMARAVAPLVPAADKYYDSADVLGVIYRNPILQKRLSGHPLLLSLGEREEFQKFAKDADVQRLWAQGPSLREFRTHERVKPLLANRELYSEAVRSLGNDVADLKVYLETGKSPKYDEEKILGRWFFNYGASMALARKNKPNMGSAEIRALRRLLSEMADSTFTGMIDNRAVFKVTPTNAPPKRMEGTWKRALGTTYLVSVKGGGLPPLEVEATVDGNQLVMARENIVRVFEK